MIVIVISLCLSMDDHSLMLSDQCCCGWIIWILILVCHWKCCTCCFVSIWVLFKTFPDIKILIDISYYAFTVWNFSHFQYFTYLYRSIHVQNKHSHFLKKQRWPYRICVLWTFSESQVCHKEEITLHFRSIRNISMDEGMISNLQCKQALTFFHLFIN